jgi:hypothetical protein
MSTQPDETLPAPPPEGEGVAWPNQQPVVDGVIPTDEVDQTPDLFEDDDDDPEMEMDA